MNINREATSRIRKIAVIVPKYGLVGGAEQFAFQVTERMAARTPYEFHVFANQWKSAEGSRVIFHKVPMIRFPRFLRPVSFAWFASRLVAGQHFDLVHAHDRVFGADLISLHCTPHAAWVRDVRRKRPSLFDRAMCAVERRMLAAGGASLFFPTSSIAMETFLREYSPLPGQWKVMHPGVDAARFSSPDREKCRAEIRGRHGIGSSDFLVLFVGMNFELKGLDTIMAAVAKARVQQPAANIRLLVVGRGDEEKYRGVARSHGIGDAVVFAGTQTGGIERYYRAADLFVMLSGFDTFGMVVLEAMAAGLPVVVSSSVGARDVVEDGVNGFVLPDGRDADAAADRIVCLLDSDRQRAMSAAASRSAAGHDWEQRVAELSAVYELKLQTKAVV
ncbi:MAG: glycosyltransferase family 4 protein [Verrucomicrobia bacterium]|nr:glycosyltransferase family 4 protein [Verrucomicrobiota bacterium]